MIKALLIITFINPFTLETEQRTALQHETPLRCEAQILGFALDNNGKFVDSGIPTVTFSEGPFIKMYQCIEVVR